MPNRALPLIMALAIAGCAGSKSEAPMASIETTTFAPSLQVALPAMTKTASGLYYRDLQVGTGTEVRSGNSVSVRYAGSLPNGRQFDATRPGDAPFVFHPGRQEVIAGWDEGVVGMKVGGRRQLILPPNLGYGPNGSGPIPPNAILVFTVEVVGVE